MADDIAQMIDFKQVKSKKRVIDHGEVFTPQNEVNSMLDLVKQETERIDSRFLEPACGVGNFLAEILIRKLEIVKKRYSKNQLDFERYSILALSSIYGVEILKDNVETCRFRLLKIYAGYYLSIFKNKFKTECLDSAKFILERNILWGDALSLRTPSKSAPLIFSEWSGVNGSLIKRRDYTMENLMANSPSEDSLFSDLGEKAFIPTPVGDYPLVHFLKLGQHDSSEL